MEIFKAQQYMRSPSTMESILKLLQQVIKYAGVVSHTTVLNCMIVMASTMTGAYHATPVALSMMLTS